MREGGPLVDQSIADTTQTQILHTTTAVEDADTRALQVIATEEGVGVAVTEEAVDTTGTKGGLETVSIVIEGSRVRAPKRSSFLKSPKAPCFL